MEDEGARGAHFEALVTEVVEPLRRFLVRRTDHATADDVLGDTLLVLWRRLDDVPGDDPLPWAYAVARGCLANATRGRQRQERLVTRLAAQPAATEGASYRERHYLTDDLRDAMTRLRPADAEVLRLWAWEGLGAGEIGRALDITPNAAGLRLHRARTALREELGKIGAVAGQEQGEGRT